VISRRTITLAAICALCIAIPVAYSKGRSFEGRRLQPDNFVQEDSFLNSSSVVFVRTIVGGEPEILRVVASVGLLLTGACLISLGFDFAPKRMEGKTTVNAQPENTLKSGVDQSEARGENDRDKGGETADGRGSR
jgi:hypothetical protein